MKLSSAALSLALCATHVVARAVLAERAPLLPSEDPFYTQPANISAYAPGQVIATRDVPPTLGGYTGLTREPLQRFLQVLYRTTDSLHNPVAAVTSILIPHNADPTKLLAYQTAYDSANNNCSPSYGLQTGANTTALADIAMITASLNKGWYVVTSDFEGLAAQFVAGEQAGYATLDSVRATLALAAARTIPLNASARYAMWGYSGGSLASEWAAELAPAYAPELAFAGAALGGLIPNVTNVLLTINASPFAGLAFSGIRGLVAALPSTQALFREQLKPEREAAFNATASGCLSQAVVSGAFQDLFTYFESGRGILELPEFKQSIDYAGIMGTHGTPTMPLFAYKAVGDEVSPAADTDALVQTLCARGATIEYHRDLVGEHFTEAITGSVSALAWVGDRLAGVPVANAGTCVVEDVALSSLALEDVDALTVEGISFLQSLLGHAVELGPLVSG